MPPKWKDYDPAWLVALARQQYPDEPELATALARCTRALWENRGYAYFVDPAGPDWDPEGDTVLLSDRKLGMVVLDRFRDGGIGGVEIVRRVPGR